MSATVLGLVLVSAFLHAAWSASIKGSARPIAFTLAHHVIVMPFAVAGVASVAAELLSPRLLACAAGTAVAHGLYGYWLALALERADLTLAYPIVRSTPALLPLLAAPLLGEAPSPIGALGIAVVVAGVWGVHGSGLRLRSLGDALLCLVPVAVAVLWTLGLMAVLGMSLNPLNVFIPLGPQTVGIEIGPHENGAYRVRDNGSGLLVRVWDHLITLEPEEDGTRYTDRVRIEAGLMTPFVWAFAIVFYRWRQARWRSLVKRQFRY